jgi:GT2 family glycosyltransferase
MKPRIVIIILNWNGWVDTIDCLESLYQIDYDNYNVIVVDNASEDDSIKKIKEFSSKLRIKSNYSILNVNIMEYGENEIKSAVLDENGKNITKELIVLKNSKNYGYAKGNNLGIQFAFNLFFDLDYILLLNNDTILEKNFLIELIKATKDEEKVGIYSPKLLDADNHRIIDSTGHIISCGRIIDRGHGKVDKHQYDDKTKVIGAKGAAALYKREMLESIGLFRESFIISYEDAELSWRANKNLWEARYVPNSVVYHKGERSIKKDHAKFSYFWGLSLRNMVSTVKEYGNNNQKISFTFFLIYFMMGSFILKVMGIRNYEINYIHLIKKLYDK